MILHQTFFSFTGKGTGQWSWRVQRKLILKEVTNSPWEIETCENKNKTTTEASTVYHELNLNIESFTSDSACQYIVL